MTDFDEVEIDNSSDLAQELLIFKQALRKFVLARFETDRSKRQKVTIPLVVDKKSSTFSADQEIKCFDCPRRVAVDIFNHEYYVLATLLDPRIKTMPFDGRFMGLYNIPLMSG